MAENFSDVTKKINLQIQEAERNSNRINPKKSMSRHMIAKLKTEDKNNLENTALYFMINMGVFPVFSNRYVFSLSISFG